MVTENESATQNPPAGETTEATSKKAAKKQAKEALKAAKVSFNMKLKDIISELKNYNINIYVRVSLFCTLLVFGL